MCPQVVHGQSDQMVGMFYLYLPYGTNLAPSDYSFFGAWNNIWEIVPYKCQWVAKVAPVAWHHVCQSGDVY